MARNKTPAAEAVEVPMNPKALAKASAALSEMGKRTAEIAERFADGLAYDRERVVAEARFHMGQSAEAMLEAGKRLIQLKENEAHGEFANLVENQLGLNVRTAQLMMAAAVKYLSPLLESKAKSISLLGRSKLFDLMVESDEDLADLAEGGTIAGKTLDEMQAMTRRELQAALAESRQTLEARGKLLEKANAKADRLQEKLDKPYKPRPGAIAQTAAEAATLQELNEAFNEAHLAALRVAGICTEIFDQHIDGEPINAHARACIDHVVKALASLAATHDINVDLAIEEAQVAPWIAAQLSPEAVEKIVAHKTGKKAR